jgi:hypothetical protein
MRYRWLVIFVVISGGLQAQRYVERIYLKDSIGYYEGHVVEQFPGSHIKLYRAVQRDTMVIAMSQIVKIVKHFKRLPRGPIGLAEREKRYCKSVYVELGGRALMYSLNFDMRAAKGSRNGWGISGGFSRWGFVLVEDGRSNYVDHALNLLPISINYLLGKKRHLLELGAGATFILGGLKGYNIEENAFVDKATSATGMYGHFLLGYRYAPPVNGIMLRLSATPLFTSSSEIRLWAGLSIGFQFW